MDLLSRCNQRWQIKFIHSQRGQLVNQTADSRDTASAFNRLYFNNDIVLYMFCLNKCLNSVF